ncbi:uncharacterized protein MELLADRAFT_111542 [Melampsora larici-populina 98AG31]|uniref:Uncharacterized protein n=1 Tax=Melampsora larici-populina (strain 98AG31 / pathotype 3-4-7) TaxID=747676 RepID=F4S3I8_MELLP|nr:uncharacterized protein MELLADRAFT_111542 [Melampsora larici-populina 98AG31]EGG00819.1 hypothetical protein MELLADRAFT_111542 [Melampsora larici-populina 98AG31]
MKVGTTGMSGNGMSYNHENQMNGGKESYLIKLKKPLRDFAMEGNEDKMRLGSMMIVRGSAGSLALVTTKGNFRNMSIIPCLPVMEVRGGLSFLEKLVLVVNVLNTGVGCAYF